MLISLSESIKQRRKGLKLSQSYVAELAGVSVNTISKIERAEVNPTIDIIQRIADVLGMDLKLEIKNVNTIEHAGG